MGGMKVEIPYVESIEYEDSEAGTVAFRLDNKYTGSVIVFDAMTLRKIVEYIKAHNISLD